MVIPFSSVFERLLRVVVSMSRMVKSSVDMMRRGRKRSRSNASVGDYFPPTHAQSGQPNAKRPTREENVEQQPCSVPVVDSVPKTWAKLVVRNNAAQPVTRQHTTPQPAAPPTHQPASVSLQQPPPTLTNTHQASGGEHFLCPDCGESFARKWNCMRHRERAHGVPQIRRETTQIPCDQDGCTYKASRFKLNDHIRNFHSLKTSERVVCPICDVAQVSHNRLAQHAALCHPVEGENFSIQSIQLEDADAFEEWRDALRVESGGSLVISSILPMKTYFVCNMSTKKNGVQKQCTAFAAAEKLESGSVAVQFVTGHLGHKKANLAQMHLSSIDRRRLVDLIKQKHTTKWIVHHLRINTDANDRLHYVNGGDVRSARFSCGATPGFHKEDMTSVRMEVEKKMGTMYHVYTGAVNDSGENFVLGDERPPQSVSAEQCSDDSDSNSDDEYQQNTRSYEACEQNVEGGSPGQPPVGYTREGCHRDLENMLEAVDVDATDAQLRWVSLEIRTFCDSMMSRMRDARAPPLTPCNNAIGRLPLCPPQRLAKRTVLKRRRVANGDGGDP